MTNGQPLQEKKKKNPWVYTTVAMAVIAVAIFLLPTTPTGMATLDSNEAASNAIDYLNNYMVQAGTSASIISVEDIGSNLYRIITSYQGQNIPIYVTKDGKFLLQGGVNLETAATTTVATTVPVSEKVDVPVANAFIMSYCPYGLQFLKAYVPVIELLGDKAQLSVNFVHYIMHNEKERDENTRMYCIQKEQSALFTDYLRCFVESDDYAACIESVGIDSTALDSCIASADEQFQIIKTYEESTSNYPPYLVDAVLANQYGVSGSPTFVLNGVVTSVARSPEAIKQAVCASFIEPPAECDTVLSAEQEAPGIGAIGSGNPSGAAGQC